MLSIIITFLFNYMQCKLFVIICSPKLKSHDSAANKKKKKIKNYYYSTQLRYNA